jgi:transposase
LDGHTQNSYLASQYRRLVGRRGKKHAPIAVGHSILEALYCRLKEDSQFADLGADFFDHLEPERPTRYYVKRLERLGRSVKLESCVSA